MNHSTTSNLFFAGLFLALSSTGISGLLGSLGLRGFAFYHAQGFLLLLALSHLGILLIGGRICLWTDRKLALLVALAIAYTTASSLLLFRFNDVVPGYVALMLYTSSIYPVTVLLLLGCDSVECVSRNSSPLLPKWLGWASAMVLLFGWIQFCAHDTLIKVSNSANVSKLVEPNLLGTFRPPSTFESSFQFGLFSVIVFCFSAQSALAVGAGMHSRALALFSAGSVLISQTRNVYLCAVCVVITMVLLKQYFKRHRSWPLIVALPCAYLVAAVMVMLWAVWKFLSSDLAKSGDLSDTSSVWARLSGWEMAWQNLVLKGSIFDVLFGYGVTQGGHASDYRFLYPARGEGLFIDSGFLNVFLYQGLIGLVLFLLTYWVIWRRLLQRLRHSPDPTTFGLACFVSAFLATGVLNIVTGQWWGVTLALAFSILRPRKRAQLHA